MGPTCSVYTVENRECSSYSKSIDEETKVHNWALLNGSREPAVGNGSIFYCELCSY